MACLCAILSKIALLILHFQYGEGSGLLRTRMDVFEVTPAGGMFKSTVDPNVSVYFPVRAVDSPMQISMQVITLVFLFCLIFYQCEKP